jgi:hypothetical protein
MFLEGATCHPLRSESRMFRVNQVALVSAGPPLIFPILT